MKQDNQIFDLISEERARQMRGIELIASENFVSDQVMAAMGSHKQVRRGLSRSTLLRWLRGCGQGREVGYRAFVRVVRRRVC